MRPLPTTPEPSHPAPRPEPQPAPAGHPLDLGGPPSSANQRRGACPTQRAYPWLLVISTSMAAVFCGLYLSKPVIVQDPPPTAAQDRPSARRSVASAAAPKPEPDAAIPSSDGLPGDAPARPKPAEPQTLAKNEVSGFEETNLRIQHVLGARGPADEDLGRIVLDVPVLYQSGVIRWNTEDVAKARSLLSRIGDYQTKSRALREEAVGLIAEWDSLVIASIPESSLRADSPTLPENQGSGTAQEATLNTTESIEISEK